MTLITELKYVAEWAQHHQDKAEVIKKAADAIEALQAENESLRNGVLDLQTQLAITCSKLATLEADAERWRKFASLDYEMRCQWVANLSLMPVLREDIDKFILDADGSINANAHRYQILRNEKYQRHEDDISVADAYFQTYFGKELDDAVDALEARYNAIDAAKGGQQ